jgi:hypothetical protein
MSETSTARQARLEELRLRRAELRESIDTLEQALAAPAPADRSRWAERVQGALAGLSADFRVHVEITEGPDGLYAELLDTSPRLSGTVDRLTHEHTRITEQIDDLLTAATGQVDVDKVRDLGTTLIGTLVRHRQRGSDLVYEAYESDIGGET